MGARHSEPTQKCEKSTITFGCMRPTKSWVVFAYRVVPALVLGVPPAVATQACCHKLNHDSFAYVVQTAATYSSGRRAMETGPTDPRDGVLRTAATVTANYAPLSRPANLTK